MPSTPERRRFERVPFYARVTLIPVAGGPPVEAQSCDLSLGGAGLICQAPLPVGGVYTLTFHLASPSGVVADRVAGTVTTVRCDDAALVGVAFAVPLGGDRRRLRCGRSNARETGRREGGTTRPRRHVE
jgi:hypothetical protein